jgi:hypothetical protein
MGAAQTSEGDKKMSNQVRVSLDSVQVTNGQGVGEGDLELRIQVLEAVPLTGHVTRVIWPSINTTRKVNNNGAVTSIGSVVGTYTFSASRITKSFVVQVTEEDTGTLGGDEFGQSSVVFDLFPGMSPNTERVLINLNNRGNNEGQVLVSLSARAV